MNLCVNIIRNTLKSVYNINYRITSKGVNPIVHIHNNKKNFYDKEEKEHLKKIAT